MKNNKSPLTEKEIFVRLQNKIPRTGEKVIIKIGERYFKVRELG